MNEIRKYATFSIDVLEVKKVNSMFSQGRARIFYMGPNPNRVIIEGEAAEKLASSIPGTPIVGHYNNITEDFEGHEENQMAYGFVPLEPNFTWIEFDEDGKSRKYLEADVVVWDGRFEEAKAILDDEKSLSMELNPETMTGTFEKVNGKTYYRVKNAEFAGITVLGDDVEPCFKDAKFLSVYSRMVSEYTSFAESVRKKEEGGISHMNIEEFVGKFRLSSDEKCKAISTAYCGAYDISGENQWYVFAMELYDDYALLYNCLEGSYKRVYYSINETDEITLGEIVDVKITDVTEEENSKLDEMKNRYELLEGEIADKDLAVETLQEQVNTITEEKSTIETDLTAKVEEVEQATQVNESLTIELEATKEVVKQYSKKAKLDIINKFSTKIEDEELIEKLTETVEELTEDEIKAQLGAALADQVLSTEDDVKTDPSNFTLNVSVDNNDLGNSVWDIVKRHKNNQ